jgi:hypothetical protein
LKLPKKPNDWWVQEGLRRYYYKALTPIDGLFDKQKEFHFDTNRFKVAQTSRRAGKTVLAATRLIEAARSTEESVNPYIALTRDSAKRILWPTLLSTLEDYGIKAEPIESELSVKFDTRSQIFLVGADQKNFIKRLRGIKTKRSAIDEAQSFGPHLGELVDDVLTPTLADFDGDIDLYGTPGPVPTGYFFDATEGKFGFKCFRWTLFDNPYMPNARNFVEALKTKRGWTDQNPTYLREWLNQWVYDEDALLFKFKRERNSYSELPEGFTWNTILGIDLGFEDATAFTTVTYSDKHPTVYITHSEKCTHMVPSEIAVRTEQLIERFKPVKIVCDTGGLGKMIAEEIRRRYSIPIHPAEKKEKASNIMMMNGDFIDGRLMVAANLSSLIHQYETLPRGAKGIEEEGYECDEADAALYAYRESKHWGFKQKIAKKESNPEEIEQNRLDKEIESYENESQKSWWEKL